MVKYLCKFSALSALSALSVLSVLSALSNQSWQYQDFESSRISNPSLEGQYQGRYRAARAAKKLYIFDEAARYTRPMRMKKLHH